MISCLRTERTRRSLRPHELADQVGVHPMSILRWERRERLPGPGHIRAIARALDLDPSSVAGFFDDARPTPTKGTGARGHGLRRLRRERGLSARGIADHLGIGVQTVYNWEGGRVRIPASVLPALAGLLCLERTDLLDVLRAAPPVPLRDARPPSALRRLRARKRISQEGAAAALGVSRRTLAAWERGSETPPLAALRGLARTYDVPVAEVAKAVGIEPPPMLDPRNWHRGDLPEVLRTLRAWSGLTQRGLASLCGCSSDAVRAWEAGRSAPSRELRQRLERLYRLGDGALAAVPPRLSSSR